MREWPPGVGLSVVTAVGDFTGGGELAIDPTRERLPCQACFSPGKQGAGVCRDVRGHSIDEHPDARVL